MRGATLGLVVLDVRRMQAQQATRSKPVSRIPLLHVPAVTSLDTELQNVGWNKPFPSQVASGYGVLSQQ